MSLGAVVPFLTVLSDPPSLMQQSLVRAYASRFGFTDASQLLLPVTIAFAVTVLLCALIRVLNLWLSGRLAAAVGSDLSSDAYRRTLYQPYTVHLQRNSASVITGITSHIGATVAAFNALLQLLTALVVAAGLLIGLVLINWMIALGSAVLFAFLYCLIAAFTRQELRHNSQMIAAAVRKQLQALHEGLGAIRDVLLDGNQRLYVESYRLTDRYQRRLQARNQYLAAFPRYTLEAVGLLAIAMLGFCIVSYEGAGAGVIPLLGVLALGAQRLLPALQQIYNGWAALKGYTASLAEVVEMLSQPLPQYVDVVEPLLFRNSLRFEAVHFRYGPDQAEVLHGLDLEINYGDRIGLIGITGSGKSTTVDLLMGLLEPSAGRLLIDGYDLHDPEHPERLAAWRAAISHVPQNIYLTDSSIAENIARVKMAAEQAQIASFIEGNPDGYHSFVGERGIRLSGGQRQRIGIARALYKQARVLVFDEATSALDTGTEEAVISAVEGLTKQLTIVMIAHRLSTVKHCNRVIRLSNGAVSADGPPGLLLG